MVNGVKDGFDVSKFMVLIKIYNTKTDFIKVELRIKILTND